MADFDYSSLQSPASMYGASTGAAPITAKGQKAKLCFAVSEIFGGEVAQGFGYFAEAYIMYKLYPEFGKKGIAFTDIYHDYAFAGSVDTGMIGFLMLKNPLQAAQINTAFTAKPHKRPDILIDNGLIKEYYEIKPDSVAGRLAGRTKLKEIDGYMKTYALPYKRGTLFTPPSTIPVGSFDITVPNVGKVNVKVDISLRLVNGMILYKICIETDWNLLLNGQLVGVLIVELFKFFKDMFQRTYEIIVGIGGWIYDHPIEAAAIAVVVFLVIIALLEPTPFGEGILALLAAAASEFGLFATGLFTASPVLIQKAGG